MDDPVCVYLYFNFDFDISVQATGVPSAFRRQLPPPLQTLPVHSVDCNRVCTFTDLPYYMD